MATIKDLKDLDITKVKSEALGQEILKLLSEYQEIEDKDFFIETNQKFIDKFFSMTKKNYPDAIKAKAAPSKTGQKKEAVKIPDSDIRALAEKALLELADIKEQYGPQGSDRDLFTVMDSYLNEALDDEKLEAKIKKAVKAYISNQPDISDKQIKKLMDKTISKLGKAVGVPITQHKPDKPKAERETSKRIMEELKKLEPEIAECRATIREYNKKKREAQGPKPKKSRYTLLKERLLSLVSLIPAKLQEDPQVYTKTEKILLKAHRELIEAWQMSKVKAKHGAEAIKDKFEAMEEKTEQKEAAAKKKAPDTVKSAGTLKVEIEYRNAGNYKTYFTHEIDLKAFPDATHLKKGDEITMGQYGTLKERDFFGSEIHPYPYDGEDDHNLLEITGIIKDQ